MTPLSQDPVGPPGLLSEAVRGYVGLWRDAFTARDLFERFLARLIILTMHTAVALVLLLIFLVLPQVAP